MHDVKDCAVATAMITVATITTGEAILLNNFISDAIEYLLLPFLLLPLPVHVTCSWVAQISACFP